MWFSRLVSSVRAPFSTLTPSRPVKSPDRESASRFFPKSGAPPPASVTVDADFVVKVRDAKKALQAAVTTAQALQKYEGYTLAAELFTLGFSLAYNSKLKDPDELQQCAVTILKKQHLRGVLWEAAVQNITKTICPMQVRLAAIKRQLDATNALLRALFIKIPLPEREYGKIQLQLHTEFQAYLKTFTDLRASEYIQAVCAHQSALESARAKRLEVLSMHERLTAPLSADTETDYTNVRTGHTCPKPGAIELAVRHSIVISSEPIRQFTYLQTCSG